MSERIDQRVAKSQFGPTEGEKSVQVESGLKAVSNSVQERVRPIALATGIIATTPFMCGSVGDGYNPDSKRMIPAPVANDANLKSEAVTYVEDSGNDWIIYYNTTENNKDIFRAEIDKTTLQTVVGPSPVLGANGPGNQFDFIKCAGSAYVVSDHEGFIKYYRYDIISDTEISVPIDAGASNEVPGINYLTHFMGGISCSVDGTKLHVAMQEPLPTEKRKPFEAEIGTWIWVETPGCAEDGVDIDFIDFVPGYFVYTTNSVTSPTGNSEAYYKTYDGNTCTGPAIKLNLNKAGESNIDYDNPVVVDGVGLFISQKPAGGNYNPFFVDENTMMGTGGTGGFAGAAGTGGSGGISGVGGVSGSGGSAGASGAPTGGFAGVGGNVGAGGSGGISGAPTGGFAGVSGSPGSGGSMGGGAGSAGVGGSPDGGMGGFAGNEDAGAGVGGMGGSAVSGNGGMAGMSGSPDAGSDVSVSGAAGMPGTGGSSGVGAMGGAGGMEVDSGAGTGGSGGSSGSAGMETMGGAGGSTGGSGGSGGSSVEGCDIVEVSGDLNIESCDETSGIAVVKATGPGQMKYFDKVMDILDVAGGGCTYEITYPTQSIMTSGWCDSELAGPAGSPVHYIDGLKGDILGAAGSRRRITAPVELNPQKSEGIVDIAAYEIIESSHFLYKLEGCEPNGDDLSACESIATNLEGTAKANEIPENTTLYRQYSTNSSSTNPDNFVKIEGREPATKTPKNCGCRTVGEGQNSTRNMIFGIPLISAFLLRRRRKSA